MSSKDMTYEQAIKRLEEIVAYLEKKDTPLEESMKLFEEGTKLAAFLRRKAYFGKTKNY